MANGRWRKQGRPRFHPVEVSLHEPPQDPLINSLRRSDRNGYLQEGGDRRQYLPLPLGERDIIRRLDIWKAQDKERSTEGGTETKTFYDFDRFEYCFEKAKDPPDNLFLSFYRLAPREPKSKAYAEHKAQYLKALAQRWNPENDDSIWHKATAKFTARQQRLLVALDDDGWETWHDEFVTDGRLIAGLGYEGPLEVGLTLHPLYGFPYLPGTAVKGAARAYAELVVRRDLKKAVDEAPDESARERANKKLDKHNRAVHLVFGSPEKNRVGCVRFFDALPTSFPELKVDVMTPHFGPYYMDAYESGTPAWKKAPGDWHDPNLVYFLTVAEDQTFQFFLAAREDEEIDDVQDCLALTRKWLEEGLKELGAGGKTSAGYGFFSDQTAAERAEELAAAVKEAREEARQAAAEDLESGENGTDEEPPPPDPPEGFLLGQVTYTKRLKGKVTPKDSDEELPFHLFDDTVRGDDGMRPDKRDVVFFKIEERNDERRAVNVRKVREA